MQAYKVNDVIYQSSYQKRHLRDESLFENSIGAENSIRAQFWLVS